MIFLVTVDQVYSRKLYRFTKREFAEHLIQRGEISFGCALSYPNELLTEAQRDDETLKSSAFTSQKYAISVGPDRNNMVQVHFEQTTMSINLKPYYLYSLTTKFDPKFFEEFNCDTCVVIENPEEFLKRFDHVFSRQGFPRSTWAHGRAQYFDEKSPVPHEISQYPYFLKRRFFGWQKEYRMTYVTPDGFVISDPNSRQNIYLDDISDIARIL